MDPLSALSMAGSIIQFTDFGGRLLSNARELYKSPIGSLVVYDEITLITADFEALVKKLRKSICANVSNEESENRWEIFRKICDEAITVAEELLNRLRTLKLNPDSKHRKWESIQSAVRNIWSKNEIASLLSRLSTLKEALTTRVLLSLRESIDLQAIQASTRFNSLDQQTQQLLSTILGVRNDISNQISQQIREEVMGITVTVSQILSRLEPASQEAHNPHLQARRNIQRQTCERANIKYENSQEIVAAIEMLSVSESAEQQVRNTVQLAILESLKYEEMTNRYEDLGEAHPETFEWAFKAPLEEQKWSDFSGWLKEGNGIYWVNGKAGSGKSTFMKHLVDDKWERLYHLLRAWARGSPLCIATFFFWNVGTRLQKSQLGLLRALLFHVLSNHPGLISTVFPILWSRMYSRKIGGVFDGRSASQFISHPTWKLRELKEAFRVLGSQTTMPVKICFVIDGLDEFDNVDGDYEELGELFKNITDSKQVKVCLSSRPWVVFEDIFEGCPRLELQELTYRDIEKYVHDKFYQNSAFLKLANREPEAAPALLKEIVVKADGVFLWVKLVVISLLDGIRNRDDLAALSERLRRLPKKLKPLYNRLFELIEPYERWASEAIQILRYNRDLGSESSDGYSGVNMRVAPITISEFSLAMSEEVQMSSLEIMTRKKFQLLCEDTKVRLTARCAGFLEVSNVGRASVMGPCSLIQYFHRTAKDFLESDEIWAKLLLETKETNFNPSVALMRSYLWYIKIQIAFSDESARNLIQYDVEASSYVEGFMACALRADLHAPSRETQTTLINQLDDLIIKHGMKKHWLYDLVPSLQGRYGLFKLSTLFGLRGYVTDRLKMLNKSDLKTTATSLFQFVSGQGFFIVNDLLFRRLEMLYLLLEFGADVKSSHTSSFQALQSAQQGLEHLRERVATNPGNDRIQSYLQSTQKLYDRIKEILGDKQAIPAVQSGAPKRLVGVIEDGEEITPKKIKII